MKKYFLLILSLTVSLSIPPSMAEEDNATNNKDWEERYGASSSKHRESSAERQPKYAHVSEPDLLVEKKKGYFCPLIPKKTIIETIQINIKNVEATIKALAEKSNCVNLSKNLDASRDAAFTGLSSALTTELSNKEPLDEKAQVKAAQVAEENQTKLEVQGVVDFVRMAGAFVVGCVQQGITKREIQQLLGQIVSYTGLLIGGYEGLAAAFGGQLLARIEFFPSAIKKAQSALAKMQEYNNQASMLCFYRDLAKNSCGLAQSVDEKVIFGYDYSFNQPGSETNLAQEMFEWFNKYNYRVTREIRILGRIQTQKGKPLKERADVLNLCRIISFKEEDLSNDTLFKTIEDTPDLALPPALTSIVLPNAKAAYSGLISTCRDRDGEIYSNPKPDFSRISGYVDQISDFFEMTLLQKESFIRKAFYAVSIYDKYLAENAIRISNTGPEYNNMFRENLLTFSDRIGKTVGKDVLDDLLDFALDDVKNPAKVRSDIAARLTLDICQTGDPRLVCLNSGDPDRDPFTKKWKSECFGRKSKVCKKLADLGSRPFTGSREEKYRKYHEDLCQ